MSVLSHEIEMWLSGGAGNTSPAASIGGARSTAQDTANMDFTPSSPFSGLTVLFLTLINEDPTVQFVAIDDFGDDRIELQGYDFSGAAIQGTTGTETGYITGVDFTANNNLGIARVTADYDVVVTPDSGTVAAAAPDDNLFTFVPSSNYVSGYTRYRCFYILNNGGASSDAYTLTVANFSGPNSVEIGMAPEGIDGTAELLGSETTTPTGVTFASTASLPVLASGEFHAVWVKEVGDPVFTPPGGLRGTASIGFDVTGLPTFERYASLAWTYEAGAIEDLADDVSFTDEFVVAYLPIDEVSFDDEHSVSVAMQFDAEDDFGAEDENAVTKRINIAEDDSVTAVDTAALGARVTINVEDNFATIDEVEISGEKFDGWVVNVETNAPSFYRWGAFTSFTKFGDDYYGTAADGIARIDSPNDDGDVIDSFFITGVNDLDIQQDKRIVRAYIAMKTDGSVLLKTVVGENIVRVYRLQTVSRAKMAYRLPLGRGVDSYHWQFALANEDGSDFEVGVIQLLPVVLKKRFR